MSKTHQKQRVVGKCVDFYPEARFKETFRMLKATFLYTLGKIRHDIKKDVLTEDPISSECRHATTKSE